MTEHEIMVRGDEGIRVSSDAFSYLIGLKKHRGYNSIEKMWRKEAARYGTSWQNVARYDLGEAGFDEA